EAPSSISQGTLNRIFQNLLDIKVYTRLLEILKGKAQERATEQSSAAQEAAEPVEEKTSGPSPETSSAEEEPSVALGANEGG
ncbi:MAG: hypothetical protein ACP5R2_08785, partial [Anaerolineae bacterium]